MTSVTAASRVTSDEPTPRPTRGTAIGSPAATTEPNAKTRISSAMSTPTSSATPLGGAKFSGTWPPSATCSPDCSVGAVAVRRASTASEPVKSVTGTS